MVPVRGRLDSSSATEASVGSCCEPSPRDTDQAAFGVCELAGKDSVGTDGQRPGTSHPASFANSVHAHDLD